jgi:hypothetical protein
MNERIERIQWIEPREVAQERAEQAHQSARDLYAQLACKPIPLGMAAVFGSLALAPESAFAVGMGVAAILVGACVPLALLPKMPRASKSAAPEITCVLDSVRAIPQARDFVSPGVFWEQARAFEIVDHPTLVGIRRLVIHSHDGQSAHFHFRPSQVSEDDLRTFVGARIAEPTAQRLLRRVQY